MHVYNHIRDGHVEQCGTHADIPAEHPAGRAKILRLWSTAAPIFAHPPWADNATGFAAHTDGRNYVTQTSALHFLRNQSEGEIQADARVRHRGHSTCLVAVDILGEDEKLLATGEFTFFCVDPEIMARKVKKA